MTSNKEHVPWDDPRWLSDDDNSPSVSKTESKTDRKAPKIEQMPQAHNFVDGEDQYQEQYVREFRQFSSNKSGQGRSDLGRSQYDQSRHFNNGARDDGNFRRSVNSDSRRRPHGDVHRNSERRLDYTRSQKGLGMTIEVQRVEDPVDVEINRMRSVYIMDNCSDRSIIGPGYDKAAVSQMRYNDNNSFGRRGTDFGAFNSDNVININKKPAMGIYDATSARGKWSHTQNDGNQDLSFTKRRPETFDRRNNFNYGDKRRQPTQDRREIAECDTQHLNMQYNRKVESPRDPINEDCQRGEKKRVDGPYRESPRDPINVDFQRGEKRRVDGPYRESPRDPITVDFQRNEKRRVDDPYRESVRDPNIDDCQIGEKRRVDGPYRESVRDPNNVDFQRDEKRRVDDPYRESVRGHNDNMQNFSMTTWDDRNVDGTSEEWSMDRHNNTTDYSWPRRGNRQGQSQESARGRRDRPRRDNRQTEAAFKGSARDTNYDNASDDRPRRENISTESTNRYFDGNEARQFHNKQQYSSFNRGDNRQFRRASPTSQP